MTCLDSGFRTRGPGDDYLTIRVHRLSVPTSTLPFGILDDAGSRFERRIHGLFFTPPTISSIMATILFQP